MLFYHFTSHEALESIMAGGLDRGEAPMSDHRVAKAVNLTTDKNPDGHGLDFGGHVADEAEAAVYAAKGFNLPAGTVFVEKRAVRITVKIRHPILTSSHGGLGHVKTAKTGMPKGSSVPQAMVVERRGPGGSISGLSHPPRSWRSISSSDACQHSRNSPVWLRERWSIRPKCNSVSGCGASHA